MSHPSYKHIASFYRTSLGKKIAQAETKQLGDILPHFFGYYLVQLSELHPEPWLDKSPIQKHVYLSQNERHPGTIASICCKFDHLPLIPGSIDVIFIPHILEVSHTPEKIIKEACQALIPEGHVIIMGFNPWSSWGIKRILKHHAREMPWAGKFIPMSKVRHWLHAQGMEISEEKTFFHRPPLDDQRWQKRLRFLEILGQYCWPFGGAIYLIVARKRLMCATPLRAKMKVKRYTVPVQVAEPNVRKEKCHETG